MVCSYCKKPIKDFYLTGGKNVYHKECYFNHVAPRCGHCGEVIEGQYVVSSGKSYHNRCFDAHVALKCDVCGGPLSGKYYVDFYGNKYHEAHKAKLTGCSCCGRLICEALTQGGRCYSDGREICTLCHMTAIKTDGQLQAAIKYTSGKLEGLGLGLDFRSVRYEMVDIDGLRRIMGNRFNHSRSQGAMTLTEETMVNVVAGNPGRRVSNPGLTRRSIAVYVLYGLSAIRFKCVLAHELTHAWFALHCPHLPVQVEEGTANLVSSLMLEMIGNEEARYILRSMEDDNDPVYGEGYRRARKHYEKEGLTGLLANVCEKKAFSAGLFARLADWLS
ncbi:MAG: protein DA1 [Nitrospirae bacterium]|nr:protein DA1 [Nitrospirota bacterium]